MIWPGDSRSKFADKLEKTLEFTCIDSKDICGQGLRGRVWPVLHHKRIAICSNTIETVAENRGVDPLAFYIEVVAHEVGHHVRWNVHRTDCNEMYQQPRFSQSVGLAAYHAYLGTTYFANDWIASAC